MNIPEQSKISINLDTDKRALPPVSNQQGVISGLVKNIAAVGLVTLRDGKDFETILAALSAITARFSDVRLAVLASAFSGGELTTFAVKNPEDRLQVLGPLMEAGIACATHEGSENATIFHIAGAVSGKMLQKIITALETDQYKNLPGHRERLIGRM